MGEKILNRKIAMVYTVVCILILIVLIASMFIIKKWEEESKEKNIENEIEKVKEYELKNKVPKEIKVKITKTGEITIMDIDEYLKGVVPSEMPPSYNIEALKAQAVVARTYTFEKMLNNGHTDSDICDNYACCQAYYNKEKIIEIWTGRGFDEKTRQEYWSKVEEAVDSTNNIVVTYKGKYIKAYFHANSGGMTESSTEIWGKQKLDYLVPVVSLGEENHSQYKSEVIFTYEDLEQKLSKGSDLRCKINSFDEIKIQGYTVSGRVASVLIGNQEYEATTLRTLLGLKSTNFLIEEANDKVVFKVTGYGHGLGMSQTGSNYYASKGWTYDQIIKHYYTGVDITKAVNN